MKVERFRFDILLLEHREFGDEKIQELRLTMDVDGKRAESCELVDLVRYVSDNISLPDYIFEKASIAFYSLLLQLAEVKK